MHLILIPLFLIALLVGIFYAGDLWKNVDLDLPDSANILQEEITPGSPLEQLGDQ